MKHVLLLLVLLLAACSPAPRRLTPHIDDTGTCAGSEIQLRQAQLYSDANNRWSLIAEATNMRVDNFALVLVCITVIWKDGTQTSEQQLIGTGLRSYETLPFRVLLQNKLDQAERVTVAAQPFSNAPANGMPVRPPTRRRNFVYSITQLPSMMYAPASIAGRLRNNEPMPMTNVRIVIGLYDNAGHLIGVANGMAADVAPIASGGVVSFTATTNMLLAPIAQMRVTIESEPAKEVIGNQ